MQIPVYFNGVIKESSYPPQGVLINPNKAVAFAILPYIEVKDTMPTELRSYYLIYEAEGFRSTSRKLEDMVCSFLCDPEASIPHEKPMAVMRLPRYANVNDMLLEYEACFINYRILGNNHSTMAEVIDDYVSFINFLLENNIHARIALDPYGLDAENLRECVEGIKCKSIQVILPNRPDKS